MSVREVEVLSLLAAAARPVPAAMIARECGIPRSSTYQIVNALVDAGFAEPADGGFRAGPRAREASRRARARRTSTRWAPSPR